MLGPNFSSFVPLTLSFINIPEENSSSQYLQCIGRIIHAITHVLGPELKNNTNVINKCISIRDILRVYIYIL